MKMRTLVKFGKLDFAFRDGTASTDRTIVVGIIRHVLKNKNSQINLCYLSVLFVQSEISVVMINNLSRLSSLSIENGDFQCQGYDERH